MSAPAFDIHGLHIIAAHRFQARLIGLLGRRALAPDQALWLAPCNNVHTFFMRFSIDVVFIDRAGVVLAIVAHLTPWRVAAAWRAHGCLELAAGGASRYALTVGQCLPQLAAGPAR